MTLGVDAGLGLKAQRNTQMLLTSKKTSLLYNHRAAMATLSVLDVDDQGDGIWKLATRDTTWCSHAW